jgi:membrane fusion protein, multidrug efflux system
VPEANVGAIKPEQAVKFTVSSFGEGQSFAGTVKFISPNVRPSTRDLVIEALAPNPDGKLRPGMFAVARLTAGERPMASVPMSAAKREEATSRVYVVVAKRVEERVVQLGGEKEGLLGILSGVKPGEQVVVSPGPDVRDGALVQ